ncbi:MAG: nucleotidyltransferase family protein [Burkholderiales bacterium]
MSIRPFLDEEAIADACRNFGVRRLELFGSGVRDPEHANDFDFLVDLEEIEPGKYARDYFGLYEALRRITGKPIDFVTPEGLTNPYFRASVEKSKRLIYAA